MASSDHDKLFAEARDQFLASLPPSEYSLFSKCASAEALIKEVKGLDVITKAERRARNKFLTSIKTFSDGLEPYFQVVSLVVQSHPEVAAIAWGAVRFVLQIASNYVRFFEKLTTTLSRIATELPKYAEIVELCKNGTMKLSERMKWSITRIYTGLMRFLQGVTRIFIKKDGNSKTTPIVVGSLVWKPFEARFSELLEELKFYDQVTKDELTILQIGLIHEERHATVEESLRAAEERLQAADARAILKETHVLAEDTKRALEQKHKEDARQRIQAWLYPPEFVQGFERAQDIRDENTAEWLFEVPQYQAWTASAQSPQNAQAAETFDSRVLWVHGNPGCGKTVLAAATVDELRILANPNLSRPFICYFFFQSGDPRLDNSSVACRAILSQILHVAWKDQDVIDRFAFAIADSQGQSTASTRELYELLHLCTQAIENCVIVLDGIDECTDQAALVHQLLRTMQSPGIKAILFSRPNVPLLSNTVPEAQSLSVGKATSNDIELFLSRKLEYLVKKKYLPRDSSMGRLLYHLVLGADGMFLWARLMFEFLASPALTQRQRLTTILDLRMPEGLDEMYLRIFRYIDSRNSAEKELARNIMMWLTFASRPLTSVELQTALKPISVSTPDDDDSYPDFAYTVIMICGSLVEQSTIHDQRYAVEVASFRFIHLSVKEYILELTSVHNIQNKDLTPAFLSFTHVSGQANLARICLEYLTFHMPAHPLSGLSDMDVTSGNLDTLFPLSNYTTYHWISHGCNAIYQLPNESDKAQRLLSEIGTSFFESARRFLSHSLPLMAWIEACYWYEFNMVLIITGLAALEYQSAKIMPFIRKLPDSMSWIQETYHDLVELGHYLQALHEDWGEKLLKNPVILWEEVTAFTPSRLLAKNTAFKVDNLMCSRPSGPLVSSRYLKKISQLSLDGKCVLVLSIWPSKKFEHLAFQGKLDITNVEIQEICSNWIAKYEVWSIKGDPVCKIDIHARLKSEEIRMQIMQSGWQDVKRPTPASEFPWMVQFPVAICRSTYTFTVLRTIYWLEILDHQGFEAGLRSSTLPLDFDSDIRESWRLERRLHTVFPPQPYLYWMRFSPDGRYLFFLDSESTKPLHLAIFETEHSALPPRALLNTLRTYGAYEHSALEHNIAAFHPSMPIIALVIADAVYIWDFTEETSLLRKCFRSDVDDPEDVSFSSCGKFVVIRLVYSETPLILALAALLGDARFSEMQADSERIPYSHCSSSAVIARARCNTLTAGYMQKSIVQEDYAAVHIHEGELAPNTLFVSQSSEKVTLQRSRTKTSGPFLEEVELTKLPNWAARRSIQSNADVLLPSIDEDMIKVVLHKGTQLWSFMSDSNNDRLPMLIQRDKRSLKPAYTVKGTSYEEPSPSRRIGYHGSSIPRTWLRSIRLLLGCDQSFISYLLGCDDYSFHISFDRSFIPYLLGFERRSHRQFYQTLVKTQPDRNILTIVNSPLVPELLKGCRLTPGDFVTEEDFERYFREIKDAILVMSDGGRNITPDYSREVDGDGDVWYDALENQVPQFAAGMYYEV